MERGGTQGVQFIVQIILARLLLPEDYGILAIVVIFINIAGIFVQSGLSTALIQKKDVDEKDYSSVFYLTLAIALLLYLMLFLFSPTIASFFSEDKLTRVIRVLSLILVLGSFSAVQNAVIAKNMQFKKLFYSSLGAIIISGAVGIFMARLGYGVWALVSQQLVNQLMIVIILLYTLSWKPTRFFSLERIKPLFSFGWKILISGLIDVIYRNISSLVIGKLYNVAMLGYYDKGRNIPNMVIANIDGSIQAVLFPAFAFYQDDKEKVKGMMRRAIRTSSFVIFPMMVGLASIAEPLVSVLLTDKWLPIVPFIQIFCIAYALWPIHTANLQVINAMGRSDIFLKLEIIKSLVGIGILIAAVPFGVYAIAMSSIVRGIISSFINAFPNRRLLGYGYLEQVKDVIPSLLLSLGMGIVVFAVAQLRLSSIITLIIQIPLGMVAYVFLAYVFKSECLEYLTTILKGAYNDKTRKGHKDE